MRSRRDQAGPATFATGCEAFLTQILNGRRTVTGDRLRLGRFFRTSGKFWLNFQKLCELRLAERENGAAIARLPTLDATRDLHCSRATAQ